MYSFYSGRRTLIYARIIELTSIALGVVLNAIRTVWPAKTIPRLGDFTPVHLLFFDITGDLAGNLRDGLAGIPRNGQGHRTE